VEEAATVDGVNAWQMLWRIKLPLLRKAIFVALVFRSIDALRTFDTVYTVTAGGPNNVTEVLSLYTYKTTFRFFDMGYGALLSFVSLALIILVSRALLPILKEQ
jgi:multiple sugar transport system permease protein